MGSEGGVVEQRRVVWRLCLEATGLLKQVTGVKETELLMIKRNTKVTKISVMSKKRFFSGI